MRFVQLALFSTIALTLALPAAAATHTRRVSTSHKVVAKHAAREAGIKRPVKAKILGQRTIDDDRATQIQTALIRAGYLSGDPSGHWDSESEAAMQKMQADSGWQTKLIPDSRALIKLGLGPGTASVASSASQPSGSQPNLLAPSAQ